MTCRPAAHAVAAVAAAVSALALPLLPTAPAAASTCSSASGVNVIVDFGGSIKTGCAAGDPASAWAALQAAGFSVEGTQRFPTTFVCRIDGFPAPAQEACIQTPPASAYWALWSAPAGGSWSYSTQGAATLNPAPGTAIGLAFGAGASPGMAPPAPTQPTTSTTRPPTTSTTKPSPTTPSPTTPGPSSTTRRPTSTTSPAGGTSTTGPAGPTASGSPDRTDASGPASDDPSVEASDPVALPQVNASTTGAPTATTSAQPAAAPASAQPSGTNPALVVGGGAAIALLLVGGAIVVRRQRDRALRE